MSNVAQSYRNVGTGTTSERPHQPHSEEKTASLNERHALQTDARPYQAQQYQDLGPPGTNGRWN
jgi:hypothetical protein